MNSRASMLLALLCSAALASPLQLTEAQLARVGEKVWKNECGGTIEGLTSWNTGEFFASLGIGHFIWYPAGIEGPFEEKFPKLLGYLQERGVKLPEWLGPRADCPWKTREEFLRASESEKMRELRGLLAATVPHQAQFLVQRLRDALPKMLEKTAPGGRDSLRARFERVLGSGPEGVFALVDYVNFKGEGSKETERYKGQGWGLLQVLEQMRDTGDPVKEFSLAAQEVLTRRVANSPPERGEARWLPGWKARVSRYPGS